MQRSKLGCFVPLLLALAYAVFAFWPYITGLHVDRDSPDAVADVDSLREAMNQPAEPRPCTAKELSTYIERPDVNARHYFHISNDARKVAALEGVYTQNDDGSWDFEPYKSGKSIDDAAREIDEEQFGPDIADMLHPTPRRITGTPNTPSEFVTSHPNMYPVGIRTSRVHHASSKYAHLELSNNDGKLIAAFPYPNSDHPDWYFHPDLPVMFLCTTQSLAIWDLATFQEIAHIEAKGEKDFSIQTSFSPDASIVAVAQGNEIHFWRIEQE